MFNIDCVAKCCFLTGCALVASHRFGHGRGTRPSGPHPGPVIAHPPKPYAFESRRVQSQPRPKPSKAPAESANQSAALMLRPGT